MALHNFGIVEVDADLWLCSNRCKYQAKMLRHNIYIIEKKISGSQDSIHAGFRSLKFV